MSCDILDHVANEVRSNKQEPPFSSMSQLADRTAHICWFAIDIYMYMQLKDWVLDVRKSRDD